MRMERFPHLHGMLGPPIASTTGAPEGDSLSVLAMLALATAFHWSVANDSVTPHGYADNWGWSTFNFGCHRMAFASVLNFSSSLRLEIDFKSSGMHALIWLICSRLEIFLSVWNLMSRTWVSGSILVKPFSLAVSKKNR